MLHTWSLGIEEQFYLVWPALLIIGLRREWRLDWLIVGIGIGSVAAAAGIAHAHIPHLESLYFLPTSHVTELASGALLAIASRCGLTAAFTRLSTTVVAGASLILVIAYGLGGTGRWWELPLLTLICWPPVAHLVLHRSSRISSGFSIASAVWLGERSYGFYLWHYPILLLLGRSLHHPWELALVGLPLSLAVTALSWRFVEQPFLRLKERFASPRVAV